MILHTARNNFMQYLVMISVAVKVGFNQMKKNDRPVLYSFRRCPYAMRARMAIFISGTSCRLREVLLRDKPIELISISPKGTVPVLTFDNGTLIDESLEIMHWALSINDPESWLAPDNRTSEQMLSLIKHVDEDFKYCLDRYKYPNRYSDVDPIFNRMKALELLAPIISRLENHENLFGENVTIADIAIFPFVRQFANTNRAWFDSLELDNLQTWLEAHVSSPLFTQVMKKWPVWSSGQRDVFFP